MWKKRKLEMKCYCVVLLTLWLWPFTFESQNSTTSRVSQGHSFPAPSLNTLGSFVFEFCCGQTDSQTYWLENPTHADWHSNEWNRMLYSDVTLRMLIDDRYCGRIIGREGKTVKKIREDTGTRISVSKYELFLYSDSSYPHQQFAFWHLYVGL